MTEYGVKIGNALHAIRRMHSDASKLLNDCDGVMGKAKASVFGNTVTRDLKYSVSAKQYMAEGLYRYYDCSQDEAGLVEGVTIYFLDEDSLHAEPVLIVGRIKYAVESATGKPLVDPWDLWHAFFEWSDPHPFDQLLLPDPTDIGHVEWASVIGVELYTINSMDAVKRLIDRVRAPRLPSCE